MSFSIIFDKEAVKYLESLPSNISERIINKFEEIKENPFRYIEHYEGEYYKIRIGDYRALIDIDYSRKILFIRIIDKRGRVYKR
ncbi:MAG: type II toxin-antitoxin system RelE/ParE family toxin [Nanoarchaeota archaeon]|nr:type II toxin-antitoxin system RelE/ParE family toxin [Nanoarchaeota archaeon]